MMVETQEQTHADIFTQELKKPKKVYKPSDIEATDMEPTKEVKDEPAKHIDRTAEFKKKRDNEIIRGRFNYITKPGATLIFNAYLDLGDSEKHIKLKDGEVVPITRKVARHLNNTGKVKVYKTVTNAQGQDEVVLSHIAKRWYFENYDFFELEDIGE